jgi:hypothetical protein
MKKTWIVAGAMVALASMAQAAPTEYLHTGDWTHQGRWKNGDMPVTGDTVKYVQAGTLTVSTGVNTKDSRFGLITLGNNGGNATLKVDGNGSGKLYATGLNVGHWDNYGGIVDLKNGRLDVQKADNTGETHIGQYATGTGTLNVSGGIFMTDKLHIGYGASTGVVNQNGGSVWADDLVLGTAGGGNSTYNLNGGMLVLFQTDSSIDNAGGTSALNFADDGFLEWAGVDNGDDLTTLITDGTITWDGGGTMLGDETVWDVRWQDGETDNWLFADTDGTLSAGKTTVWTSTIPEPATLGLIGAFGGGMLFIRRLVM